MSLDSSTSHGRPFRDPIGSYLDGDPWGLWKDGCDNRVTNTAEFVLGVGDVVRLVSPDSSAKDAAVSALIYIVTAEGWRAIPAAAGGKVVGGGAAGPLATVVFTASDLACTGL